MSPVAALDIFRRRYRNQPPAIMLTTSNPQTTNSIALAPWSGMRLGTKSIPPAGSPSLRPNRGIAIECGTRNEWS